MGDSRSTVLHRLKIARGHLDKVIRMVEADEYCIDTLTQSSAVRAQLQEAEALILERHLRTCVTDSIKNKQDEKAISEVVKVWKKR